MPLTTIPAPRPAAAGREGGAAEEDRHAPDAAARPRRLLDPGSVIPLHSPDGGGVTAVRGRIGDTHVFAYRATGTDGALSAQDCHRAVAAVEAAVREGAPVVGLWHPGGARPAEGVEALDGFGQLLAATAGAAGVPRVSVLLGPGADPGIPADLVVAAPRSAAAAGTADLAADDEAGAGALARTAVALLAGRAGAHRAGPPFLPPSDARTPYDVRSLVRALLDDGGAEAFLELRPGRAPSVVTGLGRLAGRTVGVVADDPLHGGRPDPAADAGAARFVRVCDSLGVPLLVLAESPAHPGRDERGTGLAHAFAQTRVARVTLVPRACRGGGYLAMNSRALGATAVFAWPGADVAGGTARALSLGMVDRLVDPPDTRRALAGALSGAAPV